MDQDTPGRIQMERSSTLCKNILRYLHTLDTSIRHTDSDRVKQYVDVLQLSQDGVKLEWLEGVNILPPEGDCNLFWADGELGYEMLELLD